MGSRRQAVLVALAMLVMATTVPATRTSAGVVVPITDDDLIVHADVVVLGRVTRIVSHRDVTADLSSYVTVEIDEILKGALADREITIRELGGKVGDHRAWMSVNPEFRVGERTLLFLSQHADGTLRTYQLYLGKFTILTDPASGDLVAVRGAPRTVTVLSRGSGAGATGGPASVGRELHDFAREIRSKANLPRPQTVRRRPVLPFASATMPPGGTSESLQEFRFYDDPEPFDPFPVDPTAVLRRWIEPDTNGQVALHIVATGEPLAPTLGFDQIRAAMRVWNRVPTSSFRFVEGPLVTNPALGGFAINGLNVISFRDPLEQLADPIGCGGILAAATLVVTPAERTVVNGRTFDRALESDLVVNDGWGPCTVFSGGGFYQSASNLSEVMTHELGHMLGLGHSADNTADAANLGSGRFGATMRAVAAFDGRGAALHADDRAGVTFIYPGRTLTILKAGTGSGIITSGTDGIACGSDCVAGFAVGSIVSLTATPAAGSSFAGFAEAGCGPTVVMDENRVCTASFAIAPDLRMSSVSAPTAATPGSTITVTNTVRNNGLDVLTAFNVGIYLSNTSTITTLTPLLGTRRLTGGLAFNAEDTAATQVSIPGSVPPGTYVIGAIADSDDEVDEGALENNNARAAVQSIIIGRSDLVVTTLTAPATAGAGMSISAGATVANQAALNVPAPPSTLAFYLSTDASLDPGDTRLGGTRTIPLLARHASSAGTTTLTIPANQSPGTYFLIANADDLNVVDEDNEANNTRATATQITIHRPDLTVTSVTAPAVTAAGMNVTVTHVVRNVAVAPGHAGASTSRLYLSSDEAFGGDVELGSVVVPPLAAATQASVMRSVQIPANTSVGLYWLFAHANALDTIIEAGPQPSSTQPNNRRSTTTPIIVGPDLVVTAATPTPTAVAPGRVVNVTNTVRNQGGAAALPFAVGVYFSRNASFDASDVLVATRQVAAGLAPGATSTAVTPVTIPASADAGTYFLIVRADDGTVVAEANETNNGRATVPVQVVKADLQVTSVTATPAAVAAGMSVSVTHVVRNLAVAAGGAPSSVSRLFLSTDATLDGLDVQLGGDVPVGPLAGGTQLSLVRTVQIPPGTAPGLYWVIALANATGTVQEAPGAAQANNDRATATPIRVGPDLLISAGTATPAVSAPGRTVMVANTVRNAGAEAAGPFDVAIYLSADNQYQGGVDLLLATRRVSPGLAARALSSATTPVVIPANQSAGHQFLIVRADAADEVIEGSQNNNAFAIPLTVVRADLVITALTAPTAAAPGMNVSVSHTVRNAALAAGGAPATVTRLFLSPTAATNPIDASAVPLLDVPVGALAGGASATVVRSIQVPTVAPGPYWLIAEANATGTVIEANAGNNVRATAIPLLVGPDLVPTTGTVTPVIAAPGQTVNVASTIRNQGGQSAAPFQVGFSLSSDNALDPGLDVPLGTRQVAGLAPASTSTATTPLVMPGNLSAGAYFILVLADATDSNTEASETNNLRAIPLTLVRADLTVPSVTVTPGTVAPGANVSVTHVVRNAAVAAGVAGPTTSRLYLSTTASTTLPLDPEAITPLLDVPVRALAGTAQAALVRSVQIPVGTAPGLYWIIVEANATGTVVESVPGNNAGRTATPIIVGPDLVVSAGTVVPAASAPGLTVNVSHTVRNQGVQATPPFSVGIYLSTDNVLDGTDVLLASRTVATGLVAGAMSPAVTPVMLPGNLSSTNYFLFVQADVNGQVTESDETNNRRMIPLTVVRPNLTVSSMTAPTAAAAGANISVSHVVRNVAPAAGAAPSTVSRLFFSTNQTLDGTDVQLGTEVPVGPLAGQGQAALTRTVQVPAGTVPGRYYLFAQTDAAGTVVESEEGDNTLSRPIVIGPDVTLSGVSTVAGAIPGATINVVYTLRNLGGAAAGPFNVGLTLVPVAPAGPDIPIGPTRTGVVLAAAGTLASSTPVVIPADVTPGQYRVRVTTDVTDAVLEAAENNNAAETGPVTIALPDLSMARIVVPGAGVAGRTIGISTSVTNTATPPGTAPAFRVSLYLSTDADIDPATATLLAARAVASLAAGATSTATTSVTLPKMPGHYFIGAIADRANVVLESDEGDNRLSSPIDVFPAMVRTRSASVTVTTSNCINPVNAGTRLLDGTLVISSQTGRSWTGTVSLPSNTVTLRGSVDLSGNIAGTFTIVNEGGARGGGSFAGAAGSGSAGGLAASFNGAFNVGEVCTITASLSVP